MFRSSFLSNALIRLVGLSILVAAGPVSCAADSQSAVPTGTVRQAETQDVKYTWTWNGPCWSAKEDAERALAETQEPAPCPEGYVESDKGGMVGDCGNYGCQCTTWMDCAHQSEHPWGCDAAYRWMPFKVRKCYLASELQKMNFEPPTELVTWKEALTTSTTYRSLSVFAANVRKLPYTEDNFRKELKFPQGDPIEEYQNLLSTFQTLRSHGQRWDGIYQRIVGTSYSIVQYSRNVDVTYEVILDLVTNWRNSRYTKEQIKAEIPEAVALISELINEATTRKAEAQGIYSDLAGNSPPEGPYTDGFIRILGDDGVNLRGLKDVYGKDPTQDPNYRLWTAEVAGLRARRDDLNREYEQACMIAATTPTYAWIPVYGWITAPIVGGIYGAKAEQLRKDIENASSRISYLDGRINKEIAVKQYYEEANGNVVSLERDVSLAVNDLGKIVGHWQRISKDLTDIVDKLNSVDEPQELQEKMPLVITTKLNQARKTWKSIGEGIEKWVDTAYSTFTAEQ